jgi:hypothetical protein
MTTGASIQAMTLTDCTGKIHYDNAANYPALESKAESARLHGTYSLRDNLSLKIAYRHEDYTEDD